MDKEIISKHYIASKHILLHLKTHLHRIKDGEESLSLFNTPLKKFPVHKVKKPGTA